jgi:hypothetical protein
MAATGRQGRQSSQLRMKYCYGSSSWSPKSAGQNPEPDPATVDVNSQYRDFPISRSRMENVAALVQCATIFRWLLHRDSAATIASLAFDKIGICNAWSSAHA